MTKQQIKIRLKNALVGGLIGLVLSGATIALAKADTLPISEWDQAYQDGFEAGRESIIGKLYKVPSKPKQSITEKRLFWAVAQTESNNQVSLSGGKTPIRFEPKTMKKCLSRFVRPKIPNKVYRKLTRKIKRTKDTNNYEYLALAKKYKVSWCAHWSTSYGSKQIMGFHYKLLGFKSPIKMAKAYHDNANDEFNHKMFVKFLKNYRGGKAYKLLLKHHFNDFAKVYNGSITYAKKLRSNYKLAKLEIN